MKVLIFGASGGTGRELVNQGLQQGLAVTAFVRNPAGFMIRHPNLTITQGDVTDRGGVEQVVGGHDAAISALGGSTLLKRDSDLTVGVHNMLNAMEQAQVRRFVYLSADMVPEARSELNPFRRYVVGSVLLRNVGADHELHERLIEASRLDWTIVRPPVLTSGPRTGAYRIGEHLKANSFIPRISRADVADFLLRALRDDTLLHRKLLVMR